MVRWMVIGLLEIYGNSSTSKKNHPNRHKYRLKVIFGELFLFSIRSSQSLFTTYTLTHSLTNMFCLHWNIWILCLPLDRHVLCIHVNIVLSIRWWEKNCRPFNFQVRANIANITNKSFNKMIVSYVFFFHCRCCSFLILFAVWNEWKYLKAEINNNSSSGNGSNICTTHQEHWINIRISNEFFRLLFALAEMMAKRHGRVRIEIVIHFKWICENVIGSNFTASIVLYRVTKLESIVWKRADYTTKKKNK